MMLQVISCIPEPGALNQAVQGTGSPGDSAGSVEQAEAWEQIGQGPLWLCGWV